MRLSKHSIIVIASGVVLVCAVPWFIFLSGNAAKLNNRLFPFVVTALALLPLYPLYRLAKRWPRFTSGIFLLVLSVFLSVVFAFLSYAFHVDSSWVQGMFYLSQILLVLSTIVLVWQAVRRRHT
jgi:hypothetical protein